MLSLEDQSAPTPKPGSLDQRWFQPPWVLDSWTYDLKVEKGSEEIHHTEELGDDDKGPEVPLRRTATEPTNLVIPKEGAALSALCGVASSEEDEEDRRDVALAVTMAKMIAFPPFQGVRASSDNKGPRILIDHTWRSLLAADSSSSADSTDDDSTDDDSTDDDRPVPPLAKQQPFQQVPPPLFHTHFDSLYQMWPEMIEAAATSFQIPSNLDFMDDEFCADWCVACGAIGNISLLHHVARKLDDAAGNGRAVGNALYYIDCYVMGASVSDNSTSLDLLLRFPPPQWAERIADFFHLSQGAKNPVMLHGGSTQSSLMYIYWKIASWLNPCTSRVKWDTEFFAQLQNGADHVVKDLPAMPKKSSSLLHARLLANILSKKQYHHCGGGGYMAFPDNDVGTLVSLMADRVDRVGTVNLDGVHHTQLSLNVLALELQPDEGWTWSWVKYPMKRHETVDLNLKGGRVTMSKSEIAVKALEFELKEVDKNPNHSEGHAWNSLALTMGPDTVPTVVVRDVTYTKVECAQNALSLSLEKDDFPDAYCQWDTLACILAPSTPTTPVSIETHFTDKKSGQSFRNIDCLLVALGVDPRRLPLNWVHIGNTLWRNGSVGDTALEVSIPWGAVAVLETLLTTVLESVGKTVEGAKHKLSEKSEETIGAGGKEAAVGPCDCVIKLTELECYLVAHTMDEKGMLVDIATEDPPEVMDRVIEVLTPARITEKGRRVVEASMEGVGSFEKSYSA